MDVSANIRAVRVAKGVSQAELSTRLELDASSYHRLENRGNKLSIEQVEKIAAALGLSFKELLSWGEEKGNDVPNNNPPGKLQDRIKELEEQIRLKDEVVRLYSDRQKLIEDLIVQYLTIETYEYAQKQGYQIITPQESNSNQNENYNKEDLVKMFNEYFANDLLYSKAIEYRIIRDEILFAALQKYREGQALVKLIAQSNQIAKESLKQINPLNEQKDINKDD